MSRYDQRGVSASKSEVHAAIQHLEKGLYPNAFCKILPDVANDPAYCSLMHADTAGTKTSLAYLYWRETGDLSVWRGIAQDAIVMNLDDMACVGCVDHILLSSTIGRNKSLIPGEVIAELINGTTEFVEQLRQHGIGVTLAGGETADVGDIVRTVDVGFTAFGRLRRSEVIEVNLQDGDVIIGLAAHGQTSYESEYNGGMGSNGLTSARHDVFHKSYAQRYPEAFDPNIPDEVVFTGSRRLTDPITIGAHSIPAGKLVLSPTRTYLPFLKVVLDELRPYISGIIHNTGGAHSKVKKFAGTHRVIKDNLFEPPPLFHLIQNESGTDWREMYEVFNMGTRLEVYLPERYADRVIELATTFDLPAQTIGRVEAADRPSVEVHSPHGNFIF